MNKKGITLVEVLILIAMGAVATAIVVGTVKQNRSPYHTEIVGGHRYIIRETGFGNARTESMVHDPDCPCGKVELR